MRRRARARGNEGLATTGGASTLEKKRVAQTVSGKSRSRLRPPRSKNVSRGLPRASSSVISCDTASFSARQRCSVMSISTPCNTPPLLGASTWRWACTTKMRSRPPIRARNSSGGTSCCSSAAKQARSQRARSSGWTIASSSCGEGGPCWDVRPSIVRTSAHSQSERVFRSSSQWPAWASAWVSARRASLLRSAAWSAWTSGASGMAWHAPQASCCPVAPWTQPKMRPPRDARSLGVPS
jgi:hypothetical protein